MPNEPSRTPPRRRLLAVDVARALTAIAVVAIHAVGFTLSRDAAGSLAMHVDQSIVLALRFSRGIFMFISGFALAYAYRQRHLRYFDFISRRTLRVALPYVVWSAIYLRLTAPPGESATAYLGAILLGTAFYHLYYVIVSLQWYAVFPPVLTAARRLGRRGALLAGVIVTAGYLGLTAWYSAGARLPTWAHSLAGLLPYRNQLLLFYLAYYLLGTLAGVRATALLNWLRQRAGTVAVVTAACLGYLFWVLGHTDPSAFAEVTDVFRPAMVLYSLAAAALVLALAGWIAGFAGRPRQLLLGVSHDSYVIYLAHPLVLFWLESHVVLAHGWQGPAVTLFLLAAGVVVPSLLSAVLMPTPLAPAFLGRGDWSWSLTGRRWLPGPAAGQAPERARAGASPVRLAATAAGGGGRQ